MTFPESARVTQDSNSNKDAAVRIIGLAAANKKKQGCQQRTTLLQRAVGTSPICI
jgi:hypothetical protein